jgi:hypothetical protein
MKKITTTLLCIFLFLGCAKQPLETVDKSVYTVKESYIQTNHYIEQKYQSFIQEMESFKNSFFENKIAHFILPDNVILKNRENFIKWEKDSTALTQNQTNFKNRKNNYSIQEKIEIYNKIYFKNKQDEFLEKFHKNNPIPSEDKFLSYRENLLKVYDYNLKFKEAQLEWEKHLPITHKEVSSQVLSTIFGTPLVKHIKYDAEKNRLFMNIYSAKENYENKVYIKIDSQLAREITNNSKEIIPTLYYYLIEDELELIGASIQYKQETLLATLTNEEFVQEKRLVISPETESLKNMSLNYSTVVKDAIPPKWFNNLQKTDSNEFIGYGVGMQLEEAKSYALSDIAEQKGVHIKSSNQFSKELQGDQLQRKGKSRVESFTKEQIIKGHKQLQYEKKDYLYYIAISHQEP